jgi:large subunit ribosomal protein L24
MTISVCAAGKMAFSGRCSFLGTQLAVAPTAFAPRRSACFTPIEAAYKNKLKKYGPGKHWEHYELSKNGKAIRIKMHVKKGDTVVVWSARASGHLCCIVHPCG